MNPWYKDYPEYLAGIFGVGKIQKISVSLHGTCPNRDGTIGSGGCIYCNNRSFTPSYCFAGSGVKAQIETGRSFFARKYPQMRYLAYFQAYTSTYGRNADQMRDFINEAFECDGMVGAVVGTRPDCMEDVYIGMLSVLNRHRPIFVELGVETLHDSTLCAINRGHDAATAIDTIERLSQAGIHTGVHLIAGLPGEDDEMVMKTIDRISRTGVESIKMHHLQVLKETPLADMWSKGEIEVRPYTLSGYLELCKRIVKAVPRRIAIERFTSSAPPEMVMAPKWGLKNHEFTNLLHNELKKDSE